jgi:HD-GYP domain-containing protein (c-di-GMP phosphodiesterase class II)
VVDAFAAMTSDRAYRKAMSEASALGELHRHAGTQFDPEVVDAFELALARRVGSLQAA